MAFIGHFLWIHNRGPELSLFLVFEYQATHSTERSVSRAFFTQQVTESCIETFSLCHFPIWNGPRTIFSPQEMWQVLRLCACSNNAKNNCSGPFQERKMARDGGWQWWRSTTLPQSQSKLPPTMFVIERIYIEKSIHTIPSVTKLWLSYLFSRKEVKFSSALCIISRWFLFLLVLGSLLWGCGIMEQRDDFFWSLECITKILSVQKIISP